jgi:hypothetical protein
MYSNISSKIRFVKQKEWELESFLWTLRMEREANLQICHASVSATASIKGLSPGFHNSL